MRKRLTALALMIAASVAFACTAQARSSHWEWYYRADTQCVVRHEGWWTSPSRKPPGVYAGRFQMDYSFETETAFGRWAERRWGRAWNWPADVQVRHAYEVWSYAGWSRWPTYYRYCA